MIKSNLVRRYLSEIALILIAIAIVYVATSPNQETTAQTIEPIETVLPESLMAWGFPIDSVSIDTAEVRVNQSLSDILRPKGISAYAIDRIAKNAWGVFDVRRIKSGNTYYLLYPDSTLRPNIMVYEEDITNFIVFNFDSLSVSRGVKPVDSLLQYASGTIESSLWNAFIDNGASPVLAVELSDIFAWTVDFFGVQKGDHFSVIYDALYVEGNYAGIGKIHAATFTHLGQAISAYYFENGEQSGYFDDEGNSLRKAFLKAPLRFSRISSRFSNNRYHPVLKIRRPHRGVDYAAPTGTPVYSIGDGTVVKKNYQRGGGGYYINIKHNSVYTSQYMHLNGYADGMAPGVRVKQGQVIGYVGRSGLATGPHLDFRIYKNGHPIDPLKVDAPPIEPISDSNKITFESLRDSLKNVLLGFPKEKSPEILVSQQ